MLTKAAHHRSLLAMAGVTVGVASAGVAPSPANAREPVEFREVSTSAPITRLADDPSVASHGTCLNWTRFTNRLNNYLYVPTTARNNRQTHCSLVPGNQGEGVYKLQVALNRCLYASPPIAEDGIYGDDTARAVKQAQDYHGITVDGIYGPQTANTMWWPEYDSNNGFIDSCFPL